MYYEIWDFDTSNMIDDVATEAEALALIRDLIDQNGRQAGMMLALGESDKNGSGRMIATGADLILLAQRSEPSARTA